MPRHRLEPTDGLPIVFDGQRIGHGATPQRFPSKPDDRWGSIDLYRIEREPPAAQPYVAAIRYETSREGEWTRVAVLFAPDLETLANKASDLIAHEWLSECMVGMPETGPLRDKRAQILRDLRARFSIALGTALRETGGEIRP